MPFRDKVPFLFWHCALFAPAPCPFGILAGALVLNLLPTSSCLLPVQLAGVMCQKMEINISNVGLNQNILPVTIYHSGKLRIELQTLNYYVFDPIQTPTPLPTPPDYQCSRNFV